jgi:mycothiol system anti-sigma-R factor
MNGSHMDCEKATYRVYHYLDGELTVWRRWFVKRHLKRCPPCARGFDFEMVVRRVVASKCRDEPPADLVRRVGEALGQVPPAG